MNQLCLVGRLTAKPELRYTTANVAFSTFTMAVNRPRQKDKEKETDFIDCRVWRGQAENLCKYQDKGSLIAIEGSLRKESYTNKDGEKRNITYVLADRIEFLGSKKSDSAKEEPVVEDDPFADFQSVVEEDEDFFD